MVLLMAVGKITLRMDQKNLHILLESESGDVSKHMRTRANRVRDRARALAPRGETGQLAASIRVKTITDRNGKAFQIGSDLDYAKYVIGGRRGFSARPGGGR